jgi:hypothetical protein
MKLILVKMIIQNAILKSKAIARHITVNHFLETGAVLVPLGFSMVEMFEMA